MEDKRNETTIYIGRSHPLAQIPRYETEKSVGMDIRSAGRYILFPQQKVIINTGLVVAIDSNASLDIRPRSGISSKTPLRISNAPGTVDPDYRGNVGVILENTSLPSIENWIGNKYVEMWNYLKENGLENGSLTPNDIGKLRRKLGKLYDLVQIEKTKKYNQPGIYVINPGERIAQIKMSDDSKIKFVTEKFFTDEEIEYSMGYTREEINQIIEQERETHLIKVKAFGSDRGGGFGRTGIK